MSGKQLYNLSFRQQLRIDRLPLRLIALFVGLTGFGVANALVVRAGLGADPWNVLHIAIANRTPLTAGMVVIAIAFICLVAWIPLGQKAGIGTFANAIWLGVAIDLGLWLFPESTSWHTGIPMAIVGVLFAGLFGAMYIGAQLGPGPRDGIMTGMYHRFRFPVGVTRFALEATACLLGWVLGGPIGVGTVVYVLAIGPVIQFFLGHLTIPVSQGHSTRIIQSQEPQSPSTHNPAE